jgi:hypothetical protein
VCWFVGAGVVSAVIVFLGEVVEARFGVGVSLSTSKDASDLGVGERIGDDVRDMVSKRATNIARSLRSGLCAHGINSGSFC